MLLCLRTKHKYRKLIGLVPLFFNALIMSVVFTFAINFKSLGFLPPGNSVELLLNLLPLAAGLQVSEVCSFCVKLCQK